MAHVLLIDNHDSFTWNLVQALRVLGAMVEVVSCDATLEALQRTQFDGLMISPGPGTPAAATLSNAAIRLLPEVPLLGVCLGHQCIAHVYGATVSPSDSPWHGRTSQITHDGRGVFAGLPSPVTMTRYNSLLVDPSSLSPELGITATAALGEVMGLRHATHPHEGVQFHPESILSEQGMTLLENWVHSL